MKKILKATLLLSSLAAVTACGPKNSSNSQNLDSSLSSGEIVSSSSTSSSAYNVPVTSLKTALKSLNASKNYKADVKVNGTYYYSIFVTENYVGTNNQGKEAFAFYVNDGEGIFPLDNNKGFILSGEYRLNKDGENYTDLFDNNTAKTMFNVSTAYVDSISDTATLVTISDKVYKLDLLDYVGLSRDYYVDLDSIVASYNEHLTITIKFADRNKTTYVLDFSAFGTAKDATVEDWLAKGGTVYEPDHYMSEFKRLVSSNNFVSYVYDFDTNGGDYNGVTQVYNPHYFYTTAGALNDDNKTASGYISFNRSTPIEDTSSPYCIPGFSTQPYGIYMFMKQGKNRYSFSPQTAYERPDMEYFMHYPSKLKLLDKTQFFYEGVIKEHSENYTSTDHCYILDDEALLKDFATNFSLSDAFKFDSCKPYALGVEFNMAKKDEFSLITFHYCFTYNGTKKDYLVPLTSFGITNDEVLDKFYDFYND